MRSLTLLTEQTHHFHSSATPESTRDPADALANLNLADLSQSHPLEHRFTPCASICVDSANQWTYHLVYPTNDQGPVLARVRLGPDFPDASLEVLVELPVSSEVMLTGFQCLIDLDAVYLTFSNGDIFLIRDISTSQGIVGVDGWLDHLDLVGTVDDGILSTAWSPDEEVLVVVTGRYNLILMTKEFDVLAEFPIHGESQGHDASVSVGWGKKETQFHGSAGKQAAQVKQDLSGRHLSVKDDRLPRIAWRGDGTYFVCSAVEPGDQVSCRMLRVYSREGLLLSTSESVDCLEQPLCWKPSGSLIATTEQLPHRHDVIFWERNGLRHGEFTLREPHGTSVRSLQWNCDSTVLAVVLEQGERVYVQLWTDRNYHWYLKQQIESVNAKDPLVAMAWDPEQPLLLHWVTGKTYNRYQYACDYFFGYSRLTQSLSVAGVVDGTELKLTPFKVANVPPPMCYTTATVTTPIQTVAFLHHDTAVGRDNVLNNAFAVLHHDQQTPVTLYGFAQGEQTPTTQLEELGTVLAPRTGLTLRQMVYPHPETLVFLAHDQLVNQDVILVAQLQSSIDSTNQPHWEWQTWVEKRLMDAVGSNATVVGLRLGLASETNRVFLETVSGVVYEVPLEHNDLQVEVGPLQQVGQLPEACPWVAWLTIGESTVQSHATLDNAMDESTGPHTVLVARSERHRLHLDGQVLSAHCTSFFVNDHFIMFTTADHQLRLLPRFLAEEEIVRLAKLPTTEFDPIGRRRVERASQIVCVTNNDTAVVLQMPRGNLETIHPRALVLERIRQHITQCRYREAFLLCRKHRIDMNILVDYRPEQFMTYVEDFVTQVDDPDYLNLFLSSLRNTDVCQTMYLARPPSVDAPRNSTVVRSVKVTDKREKVCVKVQQVLQRLDPHRYLTSIITASVCRNPDSLQDAIGTLCDLQTQDSADLEDTLRYLLFLTDVEKVYQAALGVYNLPLALLVAQRSQKDPKEYLAFLIELQNCEQHYRRFKIDDYLGRHSLGLEHLVRASAVAGDSGVDHPSFDDITAYTEKHKLYEVALRACADQAKQQATLYELYGDYLTTCHQHNQAARCYLQAGQVTKATQSYKQMGQWEEAIALFASQNSGKRALYEFAKKVAESLVGRNRYEAAARVYLEYTPETEYAIQLLIKGNHWFTAVRMTQLKNRADLVETTLLPGLEQAQEELKEDLGKLEDQRSKMEARLVEIRREPSAPLTSHPQVEEGLDNVDIMSEATTQITRYTQYTTGNTTMTSASGRSTRSGKTAKSRRKQERKKMSGKRGSAFEERYLLESTARLVERVTLALQELDALAQICLYFRQTARAQELQELAEQTSGRMTQLCLLAYCPRRLEQMQVWVRCSPMWHKQLVSHWRGDLPSSGQNLVFMVDNIAPVNNAKVIHLPDLPLLTAGLQSPSTVQNGNHRDSSPSDAGDSHIDNIV
ncbi:putative elongator complex protein 1 [Dispira simplex]|nr:putative elongator complex protein 1 [Dispira simplex]